MAAGLYNLHREHARRRTDREHARQRADRAPDAA